MPATRAARVVCLCIIFVVPLYLQGCGADGTAAMSGPSAAGVVRISEQELQNELDEYTDRFSGIVSAAANEIASTSPRREARKAALLWKIRVIPRLQDMIFGADPQAAFLDAATLSMQMRKYLQGPNTDGAALFGESQQIAVDAALVLEEDIFRIGGLFLNEQQLQTLRAEVDAFSDQHPIRGTFSLADGRATSTREARSGGFDWVTTIPMAPFRALEGIDAGAQAISDFNTTASQFSQIVEDMPQQVRWQIELLWYELEERESVTTALSSFQTLADSSATLAEAAATMPQDVRKQLSLALDDLEQRQDALQTMLDQTRQTLDTLGTTAGETTTLVESVNQASESLARAGDAWREAMLAVGELTAPGEPSGSTAASEPFDIKDYADTADRLAAAASELRALVTEVREAVAADDVRKISDVTLNDAEARGRSVTDHAAWRVLQLMGAAFVLAIVYRLISHQITRRGASAQRPE